MRDRLFIEEREVELQPDTVIAITLQINDFAEMVDRQANYTNQFKVPRTRANREIFELVDVVQSETSLPYRKLKARVIKEGIQVIDNGFAIIESSTDHYNVTVYGGLVDFFKIIEGKKLSDLDLSAYNHLWNFNNVMDSRINTDGYIYAIIDNAQVNYQIDNTNKTIRADYALPCMFVHTIIEKIVSEAGFVLSGDILNSPIYQNLILQIANDKWVLSGKVLNATKTDNTARYNGTSRSNFFAQDDSSGSAVLRVGNFDAQSSWFLSGGNLPHYFVMQGDYEVPNQIEVKFSGRYSWSVIGNNPEKYYISLWKIPLGTGTPVRLRTVVAPANYVMGESNVYFELSIPAGTYQQNDHFYIEALRLAHNPTSSNFYFHAGSKVEAWLNEPVPMTYGDPVVITDNLPDMSQTEFMKAVAQLFGLTYKPDAISGTMKVEGLKVLVDNIQKAKDWTDKLHMERDKNGLPVFDIRYRLGSYAQKNIFRYSNDDAVPESYGEGIINVADETLDAENETISVPFGASLSHKPFDPSIDKLVPIIRRWDTDNTCSIEVNPRVLLLNKEATNPNNISWLDINNGGTTIPDNVPFCRFINPLYPNNLGFNSSLLSDWYELLAKILERTHVLTVQMKLTPIDIAELDHFVPIYLHQFSSYFYINKVSNYVHGSRLTKVELIRIGTGAIDVQTPITLYGDEIVLNNSFDNGLNDWGGSFWYDVYGGVKHDFGMAAIELKQYVSIGALGVGTKYRIEMTVEDITYNGTGFPNTVQLLLDSTVIFTFSSDGTQVVEYTANGESIISLYPSSFFNGTVTFISIKEVL